MHMMGEAAALAAKKPVSYQAAAVEAAEHLNVSVDSASDAADDLQAPPEPAAVAAAAEPLTQVLNPVHDTCAWTSNTVSISFFVGQLLLS